MKNLSIFSYFGKRIFEVTAILFSSVIFAHDVYDAASNQLSIGSVQVGSKTYSDVVITVGSIISVGGQVDVSVPTFDLKAIYERMVQDSTSRQFGIVGAINGEGITGEGMQTVGNLTATSFQGQAALTKTSNITMNISFGGQQIPSAAVAQAYYDYNYNLLGLTGFEYEVVSSTNPFPTAARLNDAGILYNSTVYTSSSMASIIGTQTASYSISYESETTMNLTIIIIRKDTLGTVTQSTASRFRVGLDNSVVPLNSTLNNSTTFLTINY